MAFDFTQWLGDHWEYLTAVTAGCFSLYKFLSARRQELAWKRTEFIFDQARYLDCDPDISAVVAVLSGIDCSVSVKDLIDRSPGQKPIDGKYDRGLDKLLNLLDRLAYARFTTASLSHEEVANFGWYLRVVKDQPDLAKYAEANGFADVVRLADSVL